MEQEWKDFYEKNLSKFGASAQGVGWKNQEAQAVRFQQLEKLFTREVFSVNDLGCGVGDFLMLTATKMSECVYRGYDVMGEMVHIATQKYGHIDNVSFFLLDDAESMETADYTIASGIFNIRFEIDDDSWLRYILNTLRTMNKKSTAGFAFNILTKYSDREFMKPELYYADPCFLFDFCKSEFSRNVALLHDYNQYDFTIIVRKDF